MDKASPKVGIGQDSCGATFRDGCPLEQKLAHCREQSHLQLFMQSRPLFDNGKEIVPCDIDKRALACLPPTVAPVPVPDKSQTPAPPLVDHPTVILPATVIYSPPGVLATTATASPVLSKGASPEPQAPIAPVNVALSKLVRTSGDLRTHAPVTADGDLWKAIPPELLPAIVEASPCPLHVYIQLLGLTHAIRQSMKGTLREVSFPEPRPLIDDGIPGPTITPDALAALVGPCKSLRALSFPNEWCDDFAQRIGAAEAASSGGWVDEAFGGHPQLAVLTQIPLLPEPVVERILSHLPGLVELTVDRRFDMSTNLLAALARSCPGLQVLRCTASTTALAPLAPISGVLKELRICGDQSSAESLVPLVGSLTAVTSLNLPRCPPAALEPIASHLTSLELSTLLCKVDDLPGSWLCHLETLSLRLFSSRLLAPLTRLLAANQATLRSLNLSTVMPGPAEVASLTASLLALPHLTDLGFHGDSASSRLQQLVVVKAKCPASGLALDCPALVELDLSGMERCHLTSLQCPRLRTLKLPGESLVGVAMPMPNLEVADFSEWHPVEDPAWLLDGSPRLRVLSPVRLTQPDLLASLCACGSLVRLEELHLDATRLPNPLVLRLPQLEQLDLHLERADQSFQGGPPLDLQVEAPGLLDFSMTVTGKPPPSVRLRLPNSPRMARLAFNSQAPSSLSLQTDEEDESGALVAMQPRSLTVAGDLDAASLLGFLTRHGSKLLKISSRGRLLAAASVDVWPQLMGALSGLPRLTSLMMNVFGAPSPLSLACPQLRTLVLSGLPDEAKVVLACPMLEQLGGIRDPSHQVEFALPASNLGAAYSRL
ncbi:hypothetical protein PAPYR_549 [Paratrimastix pyriformis]|uniref:Uncharacterized protein n=1 Tax=Paratrimastix pyriformis TaxID=342808 RepID=A0ABQ8UXS6_9EUKA|nr:hypothetical protein PAPYR_549 [Paratrimastix pyriformis]